MRFDGWAICTWTSWNRLSGQACFALRDERAADANKKTSVVNSRALTFRIAPARLDSQLESAV